MRKLLCSFILPFKMTGARLRRKKRPATPASEKANAALQGKKILFIGNSYTMNGFAVQHHNSTVLTQKARSHDHGFFYQLCKSNGMEVAVTNWCFGGHNVTHTFGGPCTAGKECSGEDHGSYLTDRYFDYVAIQCYKEEGYTEDLEAYLRPITELFRKENPHVKFILLVPHMACERSYPWLQDLAAMQKAGFIICNWGQLVHDLCQGKVQIPGGTQTCTRSTFVVSVSEKDGHHENMLAGYLTALMVYSAITGDSAVGQTYDFCNDPNIDRRFCLTVHRRMKYIYDPRTNFVDIFRSSADMQGLQQLTDQYIAKFN